MVVKRATGQLRNVPAKTPMAVKHHRLEPDAEEPLHVVEAEVARGGEDIEVAFRHAQVLRLRQAANLDLQRPVGARENPGGQHHLVGVVLLDRKDVAFDTSAACAG